MRNRYPQGSIFPICCRGCVEGNDECRPGSLGELASLLGRVEDLVVEDGEVEGESEADGVRRLHLGTRDVERVLVRLLRALRRR